MDTARAWPLLSPAEARVLGCLVEKQATTPDVYPLTVNAAQSAANQKTARDPVMALSHGDVHHALRQLEGHRLARQSFSSRAERYEHTIASRLDLPPPQVILLALLLLRGAQTASELGARSERMHAFTDAEDVRHHLERLGARALVAEITPGGGRREARFAHLLCGPVDTAAMAADAPPASGARMAADDGMLERLAALEGEVAALRDAVAALQAIQASARTP
ncbi:YceH family protein [Luteimonas deserti]|uniref:DUF480 domain-containing protein n=1 Tax=Luteimonas deserti TaxID=2752306 RepID=A0A7Z0QT09_9GAMM|nr:DUF480 domain-containing protein [Luteimonas deserti]NYZ63391.1 DUF480 domain-containing protein [Luteimonas deserti]